MLNLLYKEFNLSIHKFYIVFAFLAGALVLIPQWPYFIALMYFFFVTVTNLSASYNAQMDNEFTVVLPVGKKEIVKARIASFVILELLHISAAAVFAVINLKLYKSGNFLLDLGPAFFGISFLMFGLFNIIFFPMYYKTAFYYGRAVIAGVSAALIFIAIVEVSVILIPSVSAMLEGREASQRFLQTIILFAGIIIFFIMNAGAARISAARFEKVDI